MSGMNAPFLTACIVAIGGALYRRHRRTACIVPSAAR
jgi:hypothetical protein